MNKLLKTYSLGVVLFLYTPILVLLVFSLSSDRYAQGLGQLTLKWYSQIFIEESLMLALKNSFIVALSASFLSVIMATFLSYAFYKYDFFLKRKIQAALKAVLVSPDISVAIGLMFLFQVLKISLGLTAIIISHVTFGIAFAFIIISLRFESMNTKLEMAARDLGASEKQAIRHIVFPTILPAVIAAFFVVFTLSWDDFVFSFFNSSAGTSTLPVQIFAMVKRGVSPQINAIGTISMLFSFILVYASMKLQRIFKIL